MRDDLSTCADMEELALALQLVHELFDQIEVALALGNVKEPNTQDKALLAAMVLLSHQIVDISQSRRLFQEKCNRHRKRFETASTPSGLLQNFDICVLNEQESRKQNVLEVEFMVSKKEQSQMEEAPLEHISPPSSTRSFGWQRPIPSTLAPHEQFSSPRSEFETRFDSAADSGSVLENVAFIANRVLSDQARKISADAKEASRLLKRKQPEEERDLYTPPIDDSPRKPRRSHSARPRSPGSTQDGENSSNMAYRAMSKTIRKSSSSRPNYAPQVTTQLKAWLSRNETSPYPSEEEKQEMCRTLDLTLVQVNNVTEKIT